MAYQLALSTITYQNNASEPLLSNRQLTFQVFDGIFYSNTLNGVISIGLIDDNDLILVCGSESHVFVEGSNTWLPVTPYLTLTDLDIDHIVIGADISVLNDHTGDMILLNNTIANELNVISINDTVLQVTGAGTTTSYQVSTVFVMIIFLYFINFFL